MNRRTFTMFGIVVAGSAGPQQKEPGKDAPSKRTFRASEIAAKVKQIIVELLGVDAKKVTDNARFVDDLGADSLNVAELVMTFEDRFDIEIVDAQAKKMVRVSDAVALVRQLLQAARRLK